MSKLTAEDYLNWFKLKPPKIEHTKLPKQRRYYGDEKQQQRERRQVPVQLYQCRELGQLYAQHYQDEHIKNAQKPREEEGSRLSSTNAGSVVGTACFDPDEGKEGRDGPRRVLLSDMASGATLGHIDLGDDTDTLRDTDTMTNCDTLPDTVSGSVFANDTDTVTVGHSLAGLEDDTIGGSVACDERASMGTAAQQLAVYQTYDFSQHNPATMLLPVYNYKKEILNKVCIYQVIVIEGKTGCGKSTQVPQYILDEAASDGRYVNICVTQPRKIAAVTLAKRVCDERKWQLGSLVGYQVGLDNCTSEDTRLVYLTTEVLVQRIIAHKSLSSFTHIVLDEVHERDQHTDFALLLVKKLLNTVSSSVKVILMSATIDVDKFARYYATPVLGHLVPAPILSVSDASQYNTTIYYLEQLAPIFKDKMGALRDEPDPVVTPELADLVVEVVKRFDRVESNTPQLPAQPATEAVAMPRGAVLVFVPGIMEIENIITKMRACAEQCKWTLFPLHSSITVEEQKQAFGPPPAGRRKVIVTTNIAESSITVPDVRYVIDLCLTKTLHCDPVTNFTCLKLAWASKASCDQRAGRAGRTSHGRVYRMVTRRFYQKLSSYSTPELVRCPLSLSVLKTKRLDMGEPAALLALALDPPNLADIARTILTLKQLGCLSVFNARDRVSALDGDLTHLGRITAQLPLDPHCSKLIVLGQALGCLREAVIVAAGLSLKSFHSNPFQDELNAHLSKMSWAYGSFSDCIAILNAYDVWQNLHGRQAFRDRGSRTRGTGICEDLGGGSGGSNRSSKTVTDGPFNAGPVTAGEVQWAKRSYVQLQQLREVHKLVEELTDRLRVLHITPCNLQQPSGLGQDIIFKLCIAGAFYPHYFCRYNSPEHERDTTVELCGHDPYSTVLVKRLPLHGAVLYEGQIRDMFKECASNITIEIENSTAYVMFRRHRSTISPTDGSQPSHIPGEFPTSMYLALKMVQVPRIRDTLQISLYSPEDTERLLTALDEEHGANLDTASTLDGTVNTSLSRATSCLSIDTSATMHSYARVLRYGSRRVLSTCGVGFKPPEMPGPSLQIWRIHVQHVESAGRLWAISEEHSVEQLHFVMSTIALVLDSGEADPLLPGERSKETIPLGEPVLAPHSEEETGKTVYRRAQIEEQRNFPGSATQVADAKQVQVLFVDYGNTALVPAASLRQMPHRLAGVPRLAVECCLSEVRPVSSSCDGAAWSEQANAFARERLSGRSFLSKVYSCVHGVMRIQLYEKNPLGEQLRCFNDVLVKKRFAVYAQESLQSQNDNQSRQSQLYSFGDSPAPPLPSQRAGYEMGTASSALSSLSLASALSTISLASDSSKQHRAIRPSKTKSRVMGPYSPLQLRFCPLYRTTESKAVKVEAASVNSTVLDMEPQNPHDRLMVASFVSLSGSETSLIARNTTLMPPIPGLMALSCLTFCHLANMRVSEDGCEYTGAVVGLGVDPATGHPLYPDEDIEITFDVPLSNDDLEKINKVRYLLSSLIFAAPGEAGSLGLAVRADRQGALRRSLLGLLDDHRRYKKPVYAKTPYKWNVIPESELLQPISCADEQLQHAVVYPLHCGVALRPHTPSTLLLRTRELNRTLRSLLSTEGARLERSGKVWELCYACDEQLVTVQDLEDHLECAIHKQRVAKLEQLAAQRNTESK